jgi:tetratricopeptide (TPR) repeat protein
MVFILLSHFLFSAESDENLSVNDLVLEETYITSLLLNDNENHRLYFQRGTVRLNLKLFDEAIDDFTIGINISPQEAAYYFYRGYTRHWQGKYQEALLDYSEAISLDETNHAFFFYRGQAKKSLNLLDEAIGDFDVAIHSNSSIAAYYFERGYAKRLQRKYREAIVDYTTAISLDETNGDYFFYRGFARDQLNDNDGALNDYSIAIESNGTQIADAYYNRGVIYKERKEHQLAINDYNQAISLSKNSSDLCRYYNSRGNAYSSAENIEQAEKDYLYAIELDPNNPDPYQNVGVMYRADLELYDKAIQYLTSAIELNPRREHTYLNRGLAYDMLGEYEKALWDLNKTFELNRNHYTVLKNRARVKAKMGDYSGAGRDYWQNEQNIEKRLANRSNNNQVNASSDKTEINQELKALSNAILLTETNPDSYFSLGMKCKNDLQLYNLAIFYFSRAVNLGSQNEYLFLNRALTYEILGKYENSLEDFDKTLKINESNLLVLKYRARIKAKLGDFEGAGIDYWQDELNFEKRMQNDMLNSKEGVDYWQAKLLNQQH